ncbi:hypothetical protein [Flaviaesturariibacter aridisoli]|uniref:TonB-dependent receptor plug domain-containing protein n=1 Tax=Flaviaesturariibacter aridisoli TaxID=2545761 RepID=A0A4V2WMC6_9BACT|nr:hypothetical protein [Flaviaesturariibacter aridisoli]TCZ67911.1 hypothetical protein E0486_14895 [Flaviaesturariibacter aridisoli]
MILRVLFLLMLGSASASLRAQGLDSLFELQRRADPREKIHVHFDKNYYNPGEIIWFKAYVYNNGGLSDSSRNFYAELLDEDGRVLSRLTAPIAFAGASGSFALDSGFARPSVLFRAYTVAMLNSDTAYLYTKTIRVLAKTKPAPVKPSAPALAFLPEGGQWVAGIPSNMAFIATDSRGLPVAVSGIITDKSGGKVADFASIHNGMGTVALLPQPGMTYTARWKDDKGKSYSTELPAPKVQGLVLRVGDGAEGKRFTIQRSNDIPALQQRLHVLASMNGALVYKADINLANRPAASGVFPTEALPTGILCITVFDSSYRPLLERVTFVNNHEYEFDGDVYLTKKDAGKRALNRVEIALSDTLPANVSLSITDADLNESNTMDDNIVSRLLLTSELRGRIVNPYYYFYSNNDSVSMQLDLVLLTHGWRRYNWEALMAGRTVAPRYRETDYLALSGQLQGLPPGRIGAGLQLNGILESADSARSFIMIPVDRKGGVQTDGLVFYDTARLYFSYNDKNIPAGTGLLQLQNGLYKGVRRIVPDSLWQRIVAEPGADVVAANARNRALIRERGISGLKAVELATITVQGRGKTPKDRMEQKYVSGLFAGEAISFDLVNDPLAPNYMSIFQYLQGKIAGLQIDGGTQTNLSWRGGTPAVYLNEMQTDVQQLQNISMSDIAYVKVFRPGESLAYGAGGGLIAVYTKKGGDRPVNNNAKGLSSTLVAGYTAQREFYAPDYASDASSGLGDFRSTLYWNPALYLDRNRRKLRLQFYNNDITRNFRLVLEGVDASGRLIHVEKRVAGDAK